MNNLYWYQDTWYANRDTAAQQHYRSCSVYGKDIAYLVIAEDPSVKWSQDIKCAECGCPTRAHASELQPASNHTVLYETLKKNP